MKRKIKIFYVCFFSVILSVSGQEIFQKRQEDNSLLLKKILLRQHMPEKFTLFNVNTSMLEEKLKKAPSRKVKNSQGVVVKLPTPLGVQRFLVKEASVFSNGLAAQFPTIKSYVGIGIDDPTAIARFSKSEASFNAMITSAKYPMYFIDPYTKDKKVSVAYLKTSNKKQDFECLIDEQINTLYQQKEQRKIVPHDGKLRTYRIAIAATGEYSQFHIAQQNISSSASDAVKKAAVLAAMNTTMTRVNGVFERDLGVTMQLVANNTSIIFLNAATDNLTNDDAEDLIDESQVICDATIGDANYDIGHTFSTGAGGLAGGAVVCLSGRKAEGVTGQSNPIGDGFDIDFVIHELGHQFGANHTQYNDCNRNNGTAVEPGSASTIMGYAGICGPNVQNNSDAYFHAISIAEMWDVVVTTATCGVPTDVGNTAPVANAGNNFTIPKSTPFVLNGNGTDVNGANNLTYNWEQIDHEQGYPMSPQSSSSGGPMFRSFNSVTTGSRYFPKLTTVLSGSLSTTWEVLPSVSRDLNFAFTVRDNVNATARDDVKITVNGASGPFVITSHVLSMVLQGNSNQTITWNVANTNVAPVNASNVEILLSTDGGLTYGTTLIASTPNDGSQQITLPNIAVVNQARIMVKSINNVFYAINDANFSIDKTASVDEVSFANLSVYPNPSKGKVNLIFDVVNSDKVAVKLIDLRGRLVSSQEFLNVSNTFSKTLVFDQITSGLYVLFIENGGKQAVKKIVIE